MSRKNASNRAAVGLPAAAREEAGDHRWVRCYNDDGCFFKPVGDVQEWTGWKIPKM